MDIKVVNLQNKKLEKVKKISNEEQKKYLYEFITIGLGLKIIISDYKLCDSILDKVDYLCIDESYRLVIVEKRIGKNTRVIRSGLMFIDYIKDNISKIKILIGDYLGTSILKDICFDCRLVILTESFTQYDYSSIKCLPYNIEAINYSIFENSLVFVKEYQSKQLDYANYHSKKNILFNNLEEYLLSLGEDISIFGYNGLITIRKIKAFMYVIIKDDSLIIYLNNQKYLINSNKDLMQLYDKVELSYDEN